MLVAACDNDHEHTHRQDQNGEPDDHSHAGGSDRSHGEGTLSLTRWTDQTELFVEFPPLVVGRASPFAVHLTRLSDFRPVDSGTVIVLLSGGGLADERFEVASPSVPGVFQPVATPAGAGRRNLTIRLESSGLTEVHELGEVVVHASEDAAAAEPGAEKPDAGTRIRFLKEQQWPIDFATEEVVERTLRPSLRMNGTLRPRADGEAWVSAPVSGRLAGAGDAFPRIGMNVEQGHVLAVIAPRLGSEADIASLELAVKRTRLDLEQARRESKRLEGLLADGAVPERRVLSARSEERQADAELRAAERRLHQHQAVQEAGQDRMTDATAVPAPITGTVAAAKVARGQFVDDGEDLFHLVDLDRLWLEVRVPEANIGDLLEPGGAWFEVQGFDEVFEVSADHIVAMGGVVDQATRTVPLLFEVDNPGRTLRIGMFARVHVLTGSPRRALALPLRSIISDGGIDTVYVQLEGESFERRIVRLGVQDRHFVEVLSGVSARERVVTRGAYAVKLAASGTQVPGHGHAH